MSFFISIPHPLPPSPKGELAETFYYLVTICFHIHVLFLVCAAVDQDGRLCC